MEAGGWRILGLLVLGTSRILAPHILATAAGLSSTHLPSPAIPGVPPTDSGYLRHPQPARHSRYHRWHCGGCDGGLRQCVHLRTGRVSILEVQGRWSSLSPLFLLPAAPLGSKIVSLSGSFPNLDHCVMGLCPQPLSFHKSLTPSDLSHAPILQMGRLRPRVCCAVVPAHICGVAASGCLASLGP